MKKYKYPRTLHLPWSLGKADDDKSLKSTSHFCNKRVIITEKLDGENTTMYNNHIHARSVDSRHHSSRDWVKNFWHNISWKIPENHRICGENVYAQHSIEYDDLESYFYGFSYWEDERCLSWDDTVNLFNRLAIIHPNIIYDGIWDEEIVLNISNGLDLTKVEGYVVRIADEFNLGDFSKSVAKFVREGHVQTNKHWSHQEVKPNKLKRDH